MFLSDTFLSFSVVSIVCHSVGLVSRTPRQTHRHSMEAPITMTFGDLEGMLRPLLQQHLQGSYTEDGDAAMEQDMNMGPALENLRKLVENHARSTQGLDVPGITLPEVDEQLGPLQQEVDDVLQRLAGSAGLRKTVPALMATALEQQLKALRPAEDVQTDADQQAAAVVAALDDSQQLEEASRLHQTMRDAINKLPALRARLEELEVRLGRNLAAVGAAQASAAQPLPTVEKVLRGVAAGRGLAAVAAAGEMAE